MEELPVDDGMRVGTRRARNAERRRVTGPKKYGVAIDRSLPLRLPVHPDAPRLQLWRRWVSRQTRPLAVDLFSGCGGLSLGLEDAGFAVILAVDNDPWALETHRHNLPGLALDLDLSERERIESLVGLLSGLPIDLIAAGPPCQPFSRAGRAKLRSLVEEGIRPRHDQRSELWQAFLEVVERTRPRAVMMENVPDMALGDDLSLLRVLTERLERAGYDVESRLLDASRHGVPQHRQRLILVGTRDGRPFHWPEPSRRQVTLRDAICDLPRLKDGTGAAEAAIEQRAQVTAFQRRMRRGMNGHALVWDHVTRPVRDDDREAFKLLKPGTRYSELPEHLRRYSADKFDDKYNRLPWDGLCRSITAHIAKDGYWYIHPEEHRTLSVREAARVQTFPDRFRFAGTRSHAFRQIGNAVPPDLARAVALEVLASAGRKPLHPGRRRTAYIAAIRTGLANWAERDAVSAPWRHYQGNPWQALVGVVLADRLGSSDESIRTFLGKFPKFRKGLAERIIGAAAECEGAERRKYLRLAGAARALEKTGGTDWRAETWAKAAALGPQERALVQLIGLGEDQLVPTTATLRVLARVFASDVDSVRKLSDGRMVLGQLVGVEPGPPRINAAFHALGRALCTSSAAHCGECTLKPYCALGSGRRS